MKASDILLARPEAVSTSRTLIDATFCEEPPPLDVFVADRKYLSNPPLSAPQYEAVRAVEQVFYMDLYPAMVLEFGPYWEPVPMINFATLMWGKGGGKDHVCRIMSLRVANLLLCLRSPQMYYAMPDQDTIHMLNVASSSTQAQRAFFTPMTRAVKRGWFEDKAEPKQNTIVFDKNVEAISGHSDAETQEGLNLILAIADEIDAFRSKEEMQFRAKQQRQPTNSSEAIIEMMQTSSSTRFPELYKNVYISYPRYLGSKIMQLTAEAKEDIKEMGAESRHYQSGPLATWEVNPRISGPEAFAKDYKKDPVLARAKYECDPAPAIDPYFRNADAVAAAFVKFDGPAVTVNYVPTLKEMEIPDNHGSTRWAKVWRWDVTFDFHPDVIPIRGARYALHADIGIRSDRCGVALSHVESWEPVSRVGFDDEDGEVELVEMIPTVRTDFVFSFQADVGVEPAPREIQIRWIRELIEELRRRAFPVDSVTFDSYQSTESIQRLRDELAMEHSDLLSTDKDPSIYANLRDLIYDLRVKAPYSAIVQREVLQLQKLPNGKIDHPPSGSKDEADAWACSVWAATLLGGTEADDREQAYVGEDDIEAFDYADMPYGLTMRG